jgi:hypothetical protein
MPVLGARTRRTYYTLSMNDFSGGWNPRDAWSEIGSNELPDMMNMTLDEQGGAIKRLGLVRANTTQIVNSGNIRASLSSAIAMMPRSGSACTPRRMGARPGARRSGPSPPALAVTWSTSSARS